MFTDTKPIFHSSRKPFFAGETAVIQVYVYENSSLENTIYKHFPNFWRGAKRRKGQGEGTKEARKDTDLVTCVDDVVLNVRQKQ